MISPTVILLAAGRGSRLGTLTAEIPKCLVQLDKRTLLGWQLAAFKHAGMNQVVVVGGYRGQLLKIELAKYFPKSKDGEQHECFPVYRINRRWERSNIVRSLLCAKDILRTTECIVCYADILFHPDHLKALSGASSGLAITYDRQWRSLWEARFSNPLDDAETFVGESGWLINIGERAYQMERICGQYMGLTLIRPSGWQEIERELSHMTLEEVDRLDMTTLFHRLLSSGIKIYAHPVDGRWCEVDSGADLALYREKLETNAQWSHDWRWEESR